MSSSVSSGPERKVLDSEVLRGSLNLTTVERKQKCRFDHLEPPTSPPQLYYDNIYAMLMQSIAIFRHRSIVHGFKCYIIKGHHILPLFSGEIRNMLYKNMLYILAEIWLIEHKHGGILHNIITYSHQQTERQLLSAIITPWNGQENKTIWIGAGGKWCCWFQDTAKRRLFCNWSIQQRRAALSNL